MACLLAAKWPKIVQGFLLSNWPNSSYAPMSVGGSEWMGGGTGATTRPPRALYNAAISGLLRRAVGRTKGTGNGER
jgi:hypothetical protein